MKARQAAPAFDPAKRCFDVLVAVSGLLLMAPVLLLTALGVKLTSPGPVLYRARRSGVGGAPFEVLKLRTMVQDADRHGAVTVGGDARITAFGRFLRRTKLDEVPQLWNILRGEMSLVGPRPESVSIVEEHFTAEYREVFTVRPGLTCTGTLYYYVFQEHLRPPDGMGPDEFYTRFLLAQKMAGDLYYLQHRSWIYDLQLLVQTALVMGQKVIGRRPGWKPPVDLAAIVGTGPVAARVDQGAPTGKSPAERAR